MIPLEHPILLASFAHIDRSVGGHNLSGQEYAIARRVIHSTADFDFLHLIRFTPALAKAEFDPDLLANRAITRGMESLRNGQTIVVDVNMVKQGIQGLVQRTFQNPIQTAIDFAPTAAPGKTLTETGMDHCIAQFPEAIYVVGNAPTALLTLSQAIAVGEARPALVIGVPVGFIGVLEAKEALSTLPCPQIRVEGNKGGSPVAAGIINALLMLAWQET
ncbi:cobalt-precorrin-8X methylmutase [Synechocystis sp. PCC 7339]|uniref:cobalt-precorrin-8X methylmutase n=1 Tax=Synechocystis sp. PCC 7339 TaxID=2782213 RepID=UPI001CC01742|nr:cobalt-precorrin-8X methylmutase [Synechocystis sp. PCC 7339]UAJ72664.1 cobalt-precorrin-8X methylmutase [Synechocystis sp. PCC 7339]